MKTMTTIQIYKLLGINSNLDYIVRKLDISPIGKKHNVRNYYIEDVNKIIEYVNNKKLLPKKIKVEKKYSNKPYIDPYHWNKSVKQLYDRILPVNPSLAEQIKDCKTFNAAEQIEMAYYQKMGYNRLQGESRS